MGSLISGRMVWSEYIWTSYREKTYITVLVDVRLCPFSMDHPSQGLFPLYDRHIYPGRRRQLIVFYFLFLILLAFRFSVVSPQKYTDLCMFPGNASFPTETLFRYRIFWINCTIINTFTFHLVKIIIKSFIDQEKLWYFRSNTSFENSL